MTWLAPHDGAAGRPAVFSDAAIQFCLPSARQAICDANLPRGIKVLFKLPLRQTAGMVTGLLRLAGLDWPVPDYTTVCRRQKNLAVQIMYRRADGPLHLLIDTEPWRRHWSEAHGEGDQVPR